VLSTLHTATTIYFSPTKPMAPSTKRDIFKDVVYVDSIALTDKHRELLTAAGGKEYVVGDKVVEWEEVTHVFSLDVDFPGRNDALTYPNIAVVTPRWVEVSSMRNVLQKYLHWMLD
jgi:hypothetical protein